MIGKLYLLHFEPSYQHAQHYLGWTSDVEVRVERHLNGRGSPLVKAAIGAGCVVTCVRVWEEKTRSDERALKAKGKNNRKLCPVCREAKELEKCQSI